VNLAIFGGTFDPVHNAHLEVARAARRECFLDKILFVPAAQPPHKPDLCVAEYEHRYEMVRLACMEHPAFEPSRLEAPSKDRLRSYTIHTLRRVAAQLTYHDRLFFLIGSDAFREITTWYHWRHIIREVEFIVVNRPGFPLDDSMIPAGARVHWLRSVNSPVASSEIRRRLAAGQTVRGWMPPQVSRYITRHGLYKPVRPVRTSGRAQKRKVSTAR
jgi:nicotinate-nucleotide adenylyltransferase